MTTEVNTTNNVHRLFENLEAQKTLLFKCTDLYKTLTSHFTTLQQSIDSKTLTLDSKLQSLDSIQQKSLEDLHGREISIPDRLSSLSSEIESKKQSAIAELGKPLDESAPLTEVLKSLCRRMEHNGLLKFVVCKRKETASLRGEMREAMKECVDPARMVLETVREFLVAKEAGVRGMADKRWACGVVVTGLFPPEELKEKKKSVGVAFSRKTVEEAEEVVRGWREKAEKLAGVEGGGSGMGSAEAAMFLQVVVGFGLKEIFDEEFYKDMVVEFAARRDMAKLAVPIFGDQTADLIDQLVKNGKEVEAVYFASVSGLTERFQPTSLLKSYLRNSKKKTADILKNGNHKAGATDEANTFEISYIRSIVRCVEDHKLESDFFVDSLKKRLSLLEKTKADKKKGSAANSSKPSNKRVHSGGGPPRNSGAPPPRPAKMRKFPSPYSSYGQREAVSRSPAVSPVSRYLGSYSLSNQTAYDPRLNASTYGPGLSSQTAYDPGLTASTYGPSLTSQTAYDPGLTATTYGTSLSNQTAYDPGSTYGPSLSSQAAYDPHPGLTASTYGPSLSSQTAYDPHPGLTASTYSPSLSSQTAYDPGLTASTYGPRYGASHVQTADQVTQQQYIVAGGSAPSPSVGQRVVSSYGLQSAYGTYDHSATSAPYQPPYAQ
ncbi:hypothetical protein SOVF_176720 [Spinacia oleracea]|uniref:FRIGIDA-like protein n=1 Tax=Spinacia oleracea TaxID=3562 RepID=A0A9R0HVZ0_SPIOL|nr:FRIGIDA-like protein 4a [Spinacia oleracea]KNA06914.1 hypothetical protein SOVF_176720 [Spinacia oleracea]